ncbi:MBL fold metallo-hydrolase [Bacillus vallismortis]|uniref:MBL fold metallo-hydrolase n=1 Tax=Bacillus vallismortis TaxID=72361 RepID=UPI00227F0FCB|nr:MBL fold metallo-hydrolase [Bacillus vallismortis]MCY7895135.1 MBL fold metallo-hydrolase [Bacillus vallismortis]MCY7919411.1 MBL fold metallo-hydrolase [Bacillus vallismortis]MEC1652022.1 MBL fold metallo-hydrolase [Bacillus vallismortis]
MIEITALSSSSKGNCYRVTDGKSPLLLECGINFKQMQKGFQFNMSQFAGCLVSHEHGDHCKAIKDVLRAGIDCYMSHGTAGAIGISHHRIKPVSAKQLFKVGSWSIMPFDVQHDVAEPYGFLLANEDGDKLLFATDTYYIKYKFPGLTHIMVECNYSNEILNENIESGRTPAFMKRRLLQSHFSLENVKEFLKANDLSRVQEIWLLHLSESNSDKKLFKEDIMKLTGKVVYIP